MFESNSNICALPLLVLESLFFGKCPSNFWYLEMVNFDLLNSLVTTNGKSDKNIFIHEFLIIKDNFWSKIFIILITFRFFSSLIIFFWFTKVGFQKKKFTDRPYDFSLSISWWYIKLLLNANYIPHRSLYTLIKILPCVCCKMNFKCTTMWESLLTLGAYKWFLASVSNLMHHKCNTLWKNISYF